MTGGTGDKRIVVAQAADRDRVAQVFGSPAHAADLSDDNVFRLPEPKVGRALAGNSEIVAVRLNRQGLKPWELFDVRFSSMLGLADLPTHLGAAATALSEAAERHIKTGDPKSLAIFDTYAVYAGYISDRRHSGILAQSYAAILALPEPARQNALTTMYEAGFRVHQLIDDTLADDAAPRIKSTDPRINGLRGFEATRYDSDTNTIVTRTMPITPAMAYDVGYVNAAFLGKAHPVINYTVPGATSGAGVRHQITLDYLLNLKQDRPSEFNELVASIRRDAGLVHSYPYRTTDRRGKTMGAISGLLKLAGVEIAVAQAVNPEIKHAEVNVVPGDLPAVLQQFKQFAGATGIGVVNS